MFNKDQEVWKTHPDYPFIEASNLGRVRTKDRTVTRSNGRKQFVKGCVLKQWLNHNGYLFVHINVKGKFVNLRVHRLVAICFIPNPDNLPEVNHIDNDRTNNSVSNLEWCTHEYNNAYREKYGVALNHPVIAINLDASEVFWSESQREAARKLDFAHQNIVAVVNGKQNTAKGFWFCNADDTAIEKTRARFGDEIVRKVEELMNKHRN